MPRYHLSDPLPLSDPPLYQRSVPCDRALYGDPCAVCDAECPRCHTTTCPTPGECDPRQLYR